jgi:hypothetical protein
MDNVEGRGAVLTEHGANGSHACQACADVIDARTAQHPFTWRRLLCQREYVYVVVGESPDRASSAGITDARPSVDASRDYDATFTGHRMSAAASRATCDGVHQVLMRDPVVEFDDHVTLPQRFSPWVMMKTVRWCRNREVLR